MFIGEGNSHSLLITAKVATGRIMRPLSAPGAKMFQNPAIPIDELPTTDELDWEPLHARYSRKIRTFVLLFFIPFAIVIMEQPIKMDYIWASLCLIGAAYFIFRGVS